MPIDSFSSISLFFYVLAEFPFIAYYVINKATTDPGEFFHNCRAASLRKFDPRTMRYTAVHTFDLFNEVATIARPPLDPTSKKPSSPSTGFIVSLYKVFEGDDGEKFEKNWLYWTGIKIVNLTFMVINIIVLK